MLGIKGLAAHLLLKRKKALQYAGLSLAFAVNHLRTF
jgi:hypothetical protein